jgi:hypothetical protein
MFKKTIFAFGLIGLLVSFFPSIHNRATAQEKAKPLDPNDPRTTFSFPIHPGWKSFRFKVELDKIGTVTGVSVFRPGESTPFQALPSCGTKDLNEQVTEGWEDYDISKLLTHADLNFDGFEDLELLQYYIPHLDKRLYCIYTWDNKTERFRYSPELSDEAVDPVPHPESKTITMRDDWQGGAYELRTYRWKGDKLELIEQNGLYGYWDPQSDGKCGFTFSCSRLVNGKMVTTLEKPVCTVDEMDHTPKCPAAATVPAPTVPPKAPKRKE